MSNNDDNQLTIADCELLLSCVQIATRFEEGVKFQCYRDKRNRLWALDNLGHKLVKMENELAIAATAKM